MPVHDWSQVDAGIFHDFHLSWIGAIRTALNKGILPKGYYALAEQHASRYITDVLTLHADPEPLEPPFVAPLEGGTAVADAPPAMRIKRTIEPAALSRRRSIAIRHVSGHRLIALLEIVSPANKDRSAHVEDFVAKAVAALDRGIHLLVVDLFPPGRHDAEGLHTAIANRLELSEEQYTVPVDEPLTMASFSAGESVEVLIEHIRFGADLPDVPLFLRSDRYVNVPLEATYREAFEGFPAFWREVLEASRAE
jgi:hypothetical protein